MRKLIVAEFISLDGVIQGPGAPGEDTSGDFRLGGWVVPFADEGIGEDVDALIAQPFELLLGRRTYEIFAAYWPQVPASAGNRAMADLFNRVPKHVATHRPASLAWQNSRALAGEPVDAVRALLQQDGPDLLTFGSGDTVRQMLAAGLVDELRLRIFPLLLGRGRRLFGDDARPSTFALSDSVITPDGVVLARYLRGGDVRTGTFSAG